MLLRLELTHWEQVTHICIVDLTIIGSDNGLSPGRRQAIIWTNAGMLLIGPLGTNFSEKLIEIHTFSFKKIPLKMSSGKWRPFCLGIQYISTLLPLGSDFAFNCVIFKRIVIVISMSTHGDIYCLQVNGTGIYRWQVEIGLGIDLVPAGEQSLLEPMLTQIYFAILHY